MVQLSCVGAQLQLWRTGPLRFVFYTQQNSILTLRPVNGP
jgi:hypothetical protein